MPRVSVLLPVYNCGRYLKAAIGSILSQTFADFEFIIVNDGSTDPSAEVIDEAARRDARIRVLTKPNGGIVAALNDGLAVATGDWIARMDGDDEALPERFARQLEFVEKSKGVVAVGTAAWLMDGAGAVVDLYRTPESSAGIEDELLQGNGAALIHPTALISRRALNEVGGYLPEFCQAEDLDLYFRLLEIGPLANLPEPLLRYRLHAASTNFSKRTEQRELVNRILTRERSRRGLAISDRQFRRGISDLSAGSLHQRWACTACTWGNRRTAWKHAGLALFAAPRDRQTWRTLGYVAGHSLGRRKSQPVAAAKGERA